jgi:tetratricopeptide (TPR) repeat protein
MTRPFAILGIVAIIALACCASPAAACLWDTDTLLDEQRGMPSVAAILAGKWERHSVFFYENRIAASRKLLETDPNNLAAMDDLAVALEKTGRVNEAIAVMKQKLAIDADGYTTHANLGTFYLHRGDPGDLDAGITHIQRALEINADAHFGRERYQLMVAQYIRDGKKNPAVFASGSFVAPIIIAEGDETRKMIGDEKYYQLLADHRDLIYHGRGPGDPKIDKAIEGVVGMIRFGTGTSPDLFYALGDLLATAKGSAPRLPRLQPRDRARPSRSKTGPRRDGSHARVSRRSEQLRRPRHRRGAERRRPLGRRVPAVRGQPARQAPRRK